MGRRLIEGSKQVKIMGEDIKVNAKIYNMKGFSAHADKEQLLEWYGKMKQPPKAFFVTHGEFDAASNLLTSCSAVWVQLLISRNMGIVSR